MPRPLPRAVLAGALLCLTGALTSAQSMATSSDPTGVVGPATTTTRAATAPVTGTEVEDASTLALLGLAALGLGAGLALRRVQD